MSELRQVWGLVLRIPLPVFFAGTFLLGWLFPITITVLLFADTLSAFVISVYVLMALPFFLATGILIRRVFTEFFPTRPVRIFNGILPSFLGLHFVVRNFWPYRVFLPEGEHDSPFDPIWSFWPQTALGFPIPVVRVFDYPLDEFGDRVIDWSSLVANLWILSWALFVLIVAEVLGRWLWVKMHGNLRRLKTGLRERE